MGKCISIRKNEKDILPPSAGSLEDDDDSIPEIVSAKVYKRVPKDQSKLLIAEALKGHYLFSGLSNDEIEILLAKLKFYEVPSGEVIFEQGSKGKKFYIIETGKMDVYKNNVKKIVLAPGKTFGEMAILTDSTRSATIKTTEDSTLWGIGREQFRAAIKKINAKNFMLNKEFISNLPIFSQLPDEQKIKLTEVIVQHDYPDNYRIICEGDEGMLLFILKSGNAVAKIKGTEKFRISPGEMFGEAVVIGNNRIRNISVYSIGKVQLLSISKDSIINIIGEDFKEIIYKTQAKNSLSSDVYFRMLPKDVIFNIIDNMRWECIKPGELAISRETVEKNVTILCLGSVSSAKKTYSHFEVIGFNIKDVQPDDEFYADTEIVLGIFQRSNLEKFTKTSCDKLKFELKVMSYLSKIDMFSGFNPSKLKYIASHAYVQEFDKKEVIYKYNDEAHEFYVIKRGNVEITQNGKILRVLGKYDVFGNKCVEETIRVNSARSISNSLCYTISSTVFTDIIDDTVRTTLQRRKSFISVFSLNQMLMIKQLSTSQHKFSFLTYVEHLDKYFDVNVISKAFFDNGEKFNQVIQEKNITLQMDHPLIQKSVNTFSDPKYVYLVNEHIETCTLATVCTKALSEDYTKFLAATLLLVLDYLQGKDIVLRNFCPQNILLDKKGYPHITDFVTAKVVKGRTYSIVGDPAYSAPEMFVKTGYGKSVDFWSLGVMIYQFLYGILPFDIKSKDSPQEVYKKIVSGTLMFPADSTYIRANEVITDILRLNPKERLTVDKLRFSRWLDSIDWESLAKLKLDSRFSPAMQTQRLSVKFDKFIPLPRYLNENLNNDTVSRKSLKFNWDKHF